jgi:hypothetical protein
VAGVVFAEGLLEVVDVDEVCGVTKVIITSLGSTRSTSRISPCCIASNKARCSITALTRGVTRQNA